MEWGRPFGDAEIVIRGEKVSTKSEALDMKCDMPNGVVFLLVKII